MKKASEKPWTAEYGENAEVGDEVLKPFLSYVRKSRPEVHVLNLEV